MKSQQNYFSKVFHKKIAIIGIEPPPLGGISVHITRVIDQFSSQYNHVALWHVDSKLRPIFPLYIIQLFLWLIKHRSDHLYYHATYLRSAVAELWVLLLFKRLFKYQIHIVDHDCRHLYHRSALALKMYRNIVNKVQLVVCIGQSVKQSYGEHQMIADNIVVDDAFIAPSLHQAAQIRARYPSSLTIFIKEHTPILLMSAAHLMRVDGRDIYGIDTMLEMMYRVQDEYPDVGLIIGLPTVADHLYFDQLIQRMRDLKICERIYILHGNNELWPLFKDTDIFIRPTLSDGDSISVREALYFNIPVVASDICQRPRGVYIFKAGDPVDGAHGIKKLLREYVYVPKEQRDHLHAQSMQRSDSLS